MRPRDFVAAFLKWIAFAILMMLNLAILLVLAVAEAIAMPIKRRRNYRAATGAILMGIKNDANKMF